MQRVLSFQMARGFGESSEFVTKRMCFSFLFSVGFLCLLCGFLTGRFAAGRAIEIRAERTRLQLAGNGLESTEHLRESLLQRLQENTFSTDYVTNHGNQDDVQRIKDALLDLQFFHRVVGNRSCIVATVRGSLEPDRYVVVSGSSEGITVLVELSKALKTLDEEFDWQPRRSLTFMISLESQNACLSFLSKHVRTNVVAYIGLDVESIGESGYFLATGSDIVLSTVLQAGAGFKNINYKNSVGENPTIVEGCGEASCLIAVPRIRLDIPNAVLTFQNAANSSSQGEHPMHINEYKKVLAQIIGTSVWRLSEMTLFQWDPRSVNNAVINRLEALNSSMYSNIVDSIGAAITKMSERTADFNDRIDRMERSKALAVRIANDISMELRRVVLCYDDNLRSRTDFVALQQLGSDSPEQIKDNLRQLLICYETANELLQEDVT